MTDDEIRKLAEAATPLEVHDRRSKDGLGFLVGRRCGDWKPDWLEPWKRWKI